MSASDGTIGPAISPPAIIFIVIVGALVVITLVASLHRICSRSNGTADDEDEKRLNPNKRAPEHQLQRMEEVRWTNNMYAWERAKVAKFEISAAFREVYRGYSHDTYHPFAEDFLALEDMVGNPYYELLDQRMRQRERIQVERRKNIFRVPIPLSSQAQPASINQERPKSTAEQHEREEIGEIGPSIPPIKVTVNDDTKDIVEADIVGNQFQHLYPAEMPRSSSLYSGDALLPMTHLRMVQNSSADTLKPPETRGSRVTPMIAQWESRNRISAR